ncbi:MAG TPA: prolipoprotein diacylglyceryl transferase family protein [Candidatus Kapabacteria bacterium]|nr:prolipoprotein diacylglyceryl transferase family protein [Candidatus Kapabacteria bacterium]
MHPILFHIGPITLYSYGLMLATAFIVASYFLSIELHRRGLDPRIGGQITIIALIGGVAGSKLFSILENWGDFVRDPIGQMFSPAGLTFYGGFLVAMAWIYFYLKRKGLRFALFADMTSPLVLLAYGIGRIGCQLAGDGDYGIPSRLPWAMSYPNGTAKPTYTLLEYFQRNPVQRAAWHYDSLASITVGQDQFGRISRFDQIVTVHPAPIYETLFCVIAFYFIWTNRKKFDAQIGKVFSIVLVVMGIERLLIEFIRINPLYWGLSMAQWISIAMIIVGGYMLLFFYPRHPASVSNASPQIQTSSQKTSVPA